MCRVVGDWKNQGKGIPRASPRTRGFGLVSRGYLHILGARRQNAQTEAFVFGLVQPGLAFVSTGLPRLLLRL